MMLIQVWDLQIAPSNKLFDWTGRHQTSASPPQDPCLPLRGSVPPRESLTPPAQSTPTPPAARVPDPPAGADTPQGRTAPAPATNRPGADPAAGREREPRQPGDQALTRRPHGREAQRGCVAATAAGSSTPPGAADR
jgi:hypothetical protein